MKTIVVTVISGLLFWILSNNAILAQENSVSDTGIIKLEPGVPIEREIEPGEIHSYNVKLDSGQFMHTDVEQHGADVMVTLFDTKGNPINIIDGRGGSEGTESVEFEAPSSGNCRMDVSELNPVAGQGMYKIKVIEILDPDEYAKRVKTEPEAVIKWLRKNAINLKTVEAGNGFEDMQPIKKLIGGSHLVAIGESTHGTREFFQLSHRMMEFLVNEMGFTVFGTESEMPEGFDINKYILTGEGDPVKAIAGLDAPLKNTEEVLDMIQWMRKYNEDKKHTRKLKWYGIDIQKTLRPVRLVVDYLSRVDPDQASGTSENLELLSNPYIENDYRSIPGEKIRELMNQVDDLLDYFDSHREDYIKHSSESEWEIARHNVVMIGQVLIIRTSSPYKPTRDSIMAENVRWIINHEGPDAKMLVWAHDGHVTNAFLSVGSMGWHLRKMYGDDIVTFGTMFNRGSFEALEMPPSTAGIHSFTVDPSTGSTIDATLSAAGLKIALVSFHDIPESGPVTDWFNKSHGQRIVSGGYTNQYAKEFLNSGYPQIFPHQYDAIIFVENTTATRLLYKEGQMPVQILDSPENLDFENSQTGKAPGGWILPSETSSFDFQDMLPEILAAINYQCLTEADQPFKGNKCVSIGRIPDSRYGESFGWMKQVIEATPFRGRKITLSAAVRVEQNDPRDKAYLWLRVLKPGYSTRGWIFNDKMADRPVKNSEWATYKITGDVTQDAVSIEYGFAFTGKGKAFIDAVTVEGVDK